MSARPPTRAAKGNRTLGKVADALRQLLGRHGILVHHPSERRLIQRNLLVSALLSGRVRAELDLDRLAAQRKT